MLKATREYGEFETDNLVVAAKSKIDEINKTIQSIEIYKKDEIQKPAAAKPNEFWDWSQSYEKWSDWNKLEDLHDRKEEEEAKLLTLYDKQEAFAHNHDHTIERQFFSLPEIEKYQACIRHFRLGEYLMQEGMYHKALEQFQIVIAYYEYCFPDENVENEKGLQTTLDVIREESLIYSTVGYIMSHEFRKAIESVNFILRDKSQYKTSHLTTTVLPQYSDNSTIPRYDRALLQRVVAYRSLDEYEEAKADLTKLRTKYTSSDGIEGVEEEARKEWLEVVEAEWLVLQTLEQNYQKTSKEQFGGLLSGSSSGASEEDKKEEVGMRAPISVFSSASSANKNGRRLENSSATAYDEYYYDRKSLPLQEYIPLEVGFSLDKFPPLQ